MFGWLESYDVQLQWSEMGDYNFRRCCDVSDQKSLKLFNDKNTNVLREGVMSSQTSLLLKILALSFKCEEWTQKKCKIM